jgi:hypothetical protein
MNDLAGFGSLAKRPPEAKPSTSFYIQNWVAEAVCQKPLSLLKKHLRAVFWLPFET